MHSRTFPIPSMVSGNRYIQKDTVMNIYICEDDPKDAERLNRLLMRYSEERSENIEIETLRSGEDLLASLQDKVADVIFLDINMDGMDGIETAGHIRERFADVPIVLVTAYMDYALEGYKVKASRFLVKDDLDGTLMECMDAICAEIRNRTSGCVLSCVEGDVQIAFSEILYIESMGHKCSIHLNGKTYGMYSKIDDLEQKLKGFGFVRTHKSFIAGIRHVRLINNYRLTLDNGEELPITRNRYKQVRQEYVLYVGRYV